MLKCPRCNSIQIRLDHNGLASDRSYYQVDFLCVNCGCSGNFYYNFNEAATTIFEDEEPAND